MKSKLRKQMMRCYLLGYIVDKHNSFRVLIQNGDYSTYKEYKRFAAKEKLVQSGIPRLIANFAVVISPHMELLISCLISSWMFVISFFTYFFTRREKFTTTRFFVHFDETENNVIAIYTSAGLGINDYVAIVPPGQHVLYKKIHTVSVLSGISFKQLWLSYVYSIRLIGYMIHKYRKDDFLFRAYSSFPFFLTFFFVDNLSENNELWISNHYDRWTYLFGYSRLRRVYIQHGRLGYDYIPRINAEVAYYISPKQKEILEFTLFNNKPEVRFRELFEYSGCEKLINNSNKNLLIYPSIVILSKSDYPKVDGVISYDSTLADEYEMHEIPVFRFDGGILIENLKDWIDSLA